MVLPARERDIISLADYFGQLTSAQIASLVFYENKSETPCRRVLKRLTTEGYLARIERRLIGGDRGGSGVYVYTLGRRGWDMCAKPGRYRPDRVINYHTLTIVDVFVKLRTDHRLGKYELAGWTPEPEAWVTVDGIELKPDLLVELKRAESTLTAFIELDMGTQRPVRINEKLDRYTRAYQRASAEQLPELPRVVFVAHTEERRQELEWIIKRHGNEHGYFYTSTASDFPDDMR